MTATSLESFISYPRLLVTGSRNYRDVGRVRYALEPWATMVRTHGTIELVHGACPIGGLDSIAADIWGREWNLPVHAVPARTVGGRFLGPERNTEMVALGNYLACLGFPLLGSRGTHDCMRKAAAAGILTMEVK